MEIGTILKYYRTMHRLTQPKVAEIAGINEKYYGRLERNESVPTLEIVERICGAFDLRMVDIFATDPKVGAKYRLKDKVEEMADGKVVYYCNCCGTTFDEMKQKTISCPNCQCEYDEENEYIERITQ